jgi:hypothetical protein
MTGISEVMLNRRLESERLHRKHVPAELLRVFTLGAGTV